MEEVDGIIVRNLRSVGCDIEDDVNRLGQFTTEMIVEAVARCLHFIDNSLDVHYKLPPSMAVRFRVGTNLANAIQGLGYHGDVGYHTFLYSNETEIRRVLMFLVDRLPKEQLESAQEPLGSFALLQKSISTEVSRRLALPWVPPFCQTPGSRAMHRFHACRLSAPRGLNNLTKPLPKEIQHYYRSSSLPYVSRQPIHVMDFPAAILESSSSRLAAQHEWESEWSQQGLASRLSKEDYKTRKHKRVRRKVADLLRAQVEQVKSESNKADDLALLIASMAVKDASTARGKGSRFAYVEKLQFAQNEDKLLAQLNSGTAVRPGNEEELRKNREEEIESLKVKLNTLTSTVEDLGTDIKKYLQGTKNMTEELHSVEIANKKKEEEIEMKKRLFDLLPDAENNINKLENLVESSSKRLVNLATQWEKHRLPLFVELRQLKELSEGQMTESQRKIEEIKEMQEKMKELAAETREKDVMYKQLVVEFEKMTKDVNRSAYTQRILEIVSNIRKQNEEIDKVLGDTKSVQKEINQLSGVLDRTFSVTDELIFRDAKKDESVRRAYKYLANLHENCGILMKSVEETGVITREIRDLEDQLETERKLKIEDNLEKIMTDFQQMRNENAILLKKLKQQQGTS